MKAMMITNLMKEIENVKNSNQVRTRWDPKQPMLFRLVKAQEFLVMEPIVLKGPAENLPFSGSSNGNNSKGVLYCAHLPHKVGAQSALQ